MVLMVVVVGRYGRDVVDFLCTATYTDSNKLFAVLYYNRSCGR